MNIAVTTTPFGRTDDAPLKALYGISKDVALNGSGAKMSRESLVEFLTVVNPEVIIAGTDQFDAGILDLCPDLKLISRVGIGLDGVDLDVCKDRGIIVTYTPDAPSNAVAELTICQMLNMLRKVQNVSDDMLIRGKWNRYIGRELACCSVGIIGMGRIGKMVADKLDGMIPRKIYINDIDPSRLWEDIKYAPVTKDFILERCDIITIHIPLNKNNRNYIGTDELGMMKSDVRLLNLSRGGLINEGALYKWLKYNPKACCALDSYDKEAYHGELCSLGNAYLTPHVGSCTTQSRQEMEGGAVLEVNNYINRQPFNNRVV